MGHSRLSPSKAYQWMVCAAAPSRSAGLPNPQNTYAIDGTFAHALAAHCLENGTFPIDYLDCLARDFLTEAEMHAYMTEDYGDEPWAFEYFNRLRVDDEMVDCITGYCDHVRQLVASDELAILMVEERLDLSGLLDESGGAEKTGGTADAIVVLPSHRRIHTIDLKYGRGRTVYAKDNPQLLLYTAGVANALEPLGFGADVYVSTIYQPRKAHEDSAEYTYDELFEFMKRAAIAAFNTRAPNPAASPGEHQCSYCLAAGKCPDYARAVFETVASEPLTDDDFRKMVEDTESPAIDPLLLGPEDFARLLPKLDWIRDWCDAIFTAAMNEAAAGRTPPGYKVVAGKMGARKWTNPEAVEDVIRNSMRIPTQLAYKMTLISPTQAEKALKPKQYKRLEEFIARSPGKPALVPESDKRPAISLAADDSEFANPQSE